MNSRQRDIIILLEQHGEMTIKDLAALFNVSEMTIHRDLDMLEGNSYLYKKRGAAVYIQDEDRNTSSFYINEKRYIGKKAASLIKPGQSIILDNSTTALETARFLDDIPNLTFYTTNLEASDILSKYQNTILYCSGGYYFPDSKGFVGKIAEDFISSIHADVCIVGTSGISIENGLTCPYPMHTQLQRKIIASANRCIVVADHSKFDRTAVERIVPLSEIDCIVTDSGISDMIYEKYKNVVKIIVADKTGS